MPASTARGDRCPSLHSASSPESTSPPYKPPPPSMTNLVHGSTSLTSRDPLPRTLGRCSAGQLGCHHLHGLTDEHIATIKALASRVSGAEWRNVGLADVRFAAETGGDAGRHSLDCLSFTEVQALRQELEEARRSLSTKAQQLKLLESVKDAFDADRRAATERAESLTVGHERETAELRLQIAALQQRLDEAGREHQDAIVRVESELTLFRTRSASAQEESGRLRSDLNRTKRELSAKVEALEDLQRGYQRAEVEVSEKEKAIAELRESLRALDEAEQLRAHLAQREAEVADLEEKLRQLRFVHAKEAAASRELVESKATELERKDETLSELRTQLKDARTMHDEDIGRLKEVRAMHDKEICQLKEVRAMHDEEISQLKEVRAMHGEEIAQLQNIKAVQDEKIAQMSAEHAALDQQIRDLQCELKKAHQCADAAASEMARKEDELLDAQKLLSAAETTRDQVNVELGKVTAQHSDLQRDLRAVKNDLERMEKDHQDHIDCCTVDLERQKTELTAAEEVISQLRSELEAANAGIVDAGQVICQLRQEVDVAKGENQRLRADLEQRLAKADMEQAALEQQIRKVQTAQKKSQEDADLAASEAAKNKTDLLEARKLLSARETTLSRAKAESAENSAQCETLRLEVGAVTAELERARRNHQENMTRYEEAMQRERKRVAEDVERLRADLERSNEQLSREELEVDELRRREKTALERYAGAVATLGRSAEWEVEVADLKEKLALSRSQQAKEAVASRELSERTAAEVEKKDVELSELRAQLEEAKATRDDNLAKADAERSAGEQKTKDLEAALKKARDDAEFAVSYSAAKEAELLEAWELASASEAARTRAEAELAEKAAQGQGLGQQLQALQAELETLRRDRRQDVGLLEDGLQRERARAASAERANSELRTELEAARARVQGLLGDLDLSKEQLARETGDLRRRERAALERCEAAVAALERSRSDFRVLSRYYMKLCEHEKRLELKIESIFSVQMPAAGRAGPYLAAV